MAVAATATSIGKNRAKAGMSNVPNPNPEKRVNPETVNATAHIIKKLVFTQKSPGLLIINEFITYISD
jgi:hypothetical protein